MEAPKALEDSCHLCTLLLPCSRGNLSPRGELLHRSCAPVLCLLSRLGATQRISLDLMGLVASWACVSGFHGTVKIRETVLDNTRALHTKQNETHSNLSVNEA